MIVDIYLLEHTRHARQRSRPAERVAPEGFEVILEGSVDEYGDTYDRVRLPSSDGICPEQGGDCYSCTVIAPVARYVMARYPNGQSALLEVDYTFNEVDE